MAELDGIVTPMFEVNCFICEKYLYGLARTKWQSELVLLEYSWSKVNNRWHCPACTTAKLLKEERNTRRRP